MNSRTLIPNKKRSRPIHPYIYVTKNHEVQGPYTLAEIRERITSNQYGGDDLSWQEGMEDWIPLSALINSIPENSAKTNHFSRKSSGYSRASFYIGIIGMALWLLIFMPTAAIISTDESDASMWMHTAKAMMIGMASANLIGIIFSILAFLNRYSSNSKAIYGLFLNIIVILMTSAILVRG